MSGIGRLPQPPGLQDPRFEDWLNQLRTQTLSHGFAPGVGNGGTVTQATSKSTAVTLNKSCGQITLNAANLVGRGCGVVHRQ
jgi:predicted dienelactone hydrolase